MNRNSVESVVPSVKDHGGRHVEQSLILHPGTTLPSKPRDIDKKKFRQHRDLLCFGGRIFDWPIERCSADALAGYGRCTTTQQGIEVAFPMHANMEGKYRWPDWKRVVVGSIAGLSAPAEIT